MLTAKQKKLLMFIQERVSASGVSPSFDEMKDAMGLKSKSGVHRLINALEERGFIHRMPNRARALEILKLPDAISQAVSQAMNPQTLAAGATMAANNPMQALKTATGAASSVANMASNVLAGAFGAQPQTDEQPAPVNEDMVELPMHGKIAAGTPIEALENIDTHIAVPAGMVSSGTCYALEISGDSMIELGILDGDTVVIESTNTARDGEVVVALVDREEATLKTLQRKADHIALIPANRDHETQIYKADQVEVQGRLVGLMRNYH